MGRQPNQISGNLPGMILAVLERGPLHGYGIARAIEERSADALSFGEGTLYPALRTLESNGHVEASWDTSGSSGPAKKVYAITLQGEEELGRLRQAWDQYCRSVDKVMGASPKPLRA